MMKQEEKYLILNNSYQFYAIFRCDRQTVMDYMTFGLEHMLNPDGSINLDDLSEWLVTRGISHRAQFQKEDNPILKRFLKHEIRRMNQTASEHGLFVTDRELYAFLRKMKTGNRELCWNTAGLSNH
jgi:hypothetical protein